MKYLIADLVTEMELKYDHFRNLAKPFEYSGDGNTDISLSVSDEHINSLIKRMVPGTTIVAAEEYAYEGIICKSINK